MGRSHCYPTTIRLRLLSGSSFQKSKFRSLPFLMYKLLVQVPRMGEATWEKANQVEGRLALIYSQAKAEVSISSGFMILQAPLSCGLSKL